MSKSRYYKIKKKGVEKNIMKVISFTADILEENIKFDEDEILDVKWVDIEEIKNMKEKELRGYKANIKVIENIRKNQIYPIEIFDNEKFKINKKGANISEEQLYKSIE